VDGKATRACSTTIEAVAGKQVTTIEAMESHRIGQALQAAWIRHDVPQCGYCQSGQIMQAAALLKQKPKPTDADIDTAMKGNICRCGTYQRIREAIKIAANKTAASSPPSSKPAAAKRTAGVKK
jgi:isoquinoline 1-oxidoreductase alpha subunit